MRKEPKTPKSSGRKRQAVSGRRNLLKFRESNQRPALAHGIHATIASGGAAVPPVPHADEIRADVDALLAEMVNDLGGESEVTAAQKTILQSQRLCLLVLGLASSYLSREGIINPKSGRPHALLSVAATYANAARLNAVTLGLERRARKVGPASLAEYLESREKAEPVAEAEAPAEAEGEAEATHETEAQE